ncbi:MAG: hypothetical protein ABIZ95_21515 [Pyrinomonadaceae bacterium]
MKKLIALTLSLASLGLFATSAEARSSRSPAVSQMDQTSSQFRRQDRQRDRRWRDRNRWEDNHRNDRVRVFTESRIVRYYGHPYREIVQIRVWPNGRTETRVLSRVRIR